MKKETSFAGTNYDKDARLSTASELEAKFALCGPAFTVRIIDAKMPNAPPKMSSHFVDLIERGCVVIIESPPCENRFI